MGSFYKAKPHVLAVDRLSAERKVLIFSSSSWVMTFDLFRGESSINSQGDEWTQNILDGNGALEPEQTQKNRESLRRATYRFPRCLMAKRGQYSNIMDGGVPHILTVHRLNLSSSVEDALETSPGWALRTDTDWCDSTT